MINKNKFSIKDTKKVLHKVGKRWVVVSAVLLGLAAGGAAVTTANADTTAQAAQPTAAQQVTKNANMSAANHSFGAADPANATKAPSTMKLGAANNTNNISGEISGEVNEAKTKVASADSLVHQDAHEVNFPNAVRFANRAREVSNGSSAYSDLVNLASSAVDNASTVKVGNTNGNDNNTLFSMFDKAENDITTLAGTTPVSGDASLANQPQLDKIVNGSAKVSSLLASSVSVSSNVNSAKSISLNVPTTSLSTAANQAIDEVKKLETEVNSLAEDYGNDTLQTLITSAKGNLNEIKTFQAQYPTASTLNDVITAANDGVIAPAQAAKGKITTTISPDNTVAPQGSNTKLSDVISKEYVKATTTDKYNNPNRVTDVATAEFLKKVASKLPQGTSATLSDVTNADDKIINSAKGVKGQINTIAANAPQHANTKLSDITTKASEDIAEAKALQTQYSTETLNEIRGIKDTEATTLITHLNSLKSVSSVSESVSVPVSVSATISLTASDVINNGLNVSSSVDPIVSKAFNSTITSLESSSNNTVMSSLVNNINNSQIPSMLGMSQASYSSLAKAENLPEVSMGTAITYLKSYLNNSSSSNYYSLSSEATNMASSALGSIYDIKFSAPASYTAQSLASELSAGGDIYSDVNKLLSGNSLTTANSYMAKVNTLLNKVPDLNVIQGFEGYTSLYDDALALPSATNNASLASSVYYNIYGNGSNSSGNGQKFVSALSSVNSRNGDNAKVAKVISALNTHFVQPAGSMSAVLSGMMSASNRASDAISNATSNEKTEEQNLLSTGSNNVIPKVNSGISNYIAHASGAYTPSLATDNINFIDTYEGHKSVGSTAMTGLSGNSFNANSTDLNIPSSYEAVSGSNINFDGQGHNFDVALSNVVDKVNFVDSNNKLIERTNQTVNGVEGTKPDLSKLQLPTSNKYSLGNVNGLMLTNNGILNVPIVLKSNPVKPNKPSKPTNNNKVTETFYFNGDGNASAVVSGSANTLGSVSAPSGYTFLDGGSLADFTYGTSNGSMTVDVVSASTNTKPTNNSKVTETFYFNGDGNASATVSGSANTLGSVSAPSGYTFLDGGSLADFTYGTSNGSMTVDVVSASTSSNSQSSSASSSASSANSKANSKASSKASSKANNNSGMPFIPSFNGGSMTSPSTSASIEPSMASSNSSSASAKSEATAKYVEYAKVNKALQLHTNPNFSKKNAVAVLEPGAKLQILHTVKAHNGLTRYEVRYNHKNYYITANKKFVSTYKVAVNKHASKVMNYIHYRYAKVVKALQLHTSAKFTKRNGVKVVKPDTEFHINHIVKNGKYVRYEVRYQGHNYFITANHNYTVNAYVQNYNFHKHGYKAVRVIKPLNEYRKLSFAKRSLVRHFYRGSVLPVKRVITIAKGEMTRLQLTNGRYVSANKDFVKVIK